MLNLENALNIEVIFSIKNIRLNGTMKVIKNASSLKITIRNGEELITYRDEVSTHDVNNFVALYNLTTYRVNNMLTMLPSHDDTYNVVLL